MKRKIQLIFVVMIMVFSGWGCSPSGGDLQGVLEQAEKMVAAGQYQSAVAAYRRALEVDPDSLEAWAGLAEVALKLGDVKTAGDAYQRILSLDPDRVDAELKLAEFDLMTGAAERAEERIAQVLERKADHAGALFILAEIAKQQNQMTRAVGIYEEIIERQERDKTAVVKALIGLAEIQARRGELDAAAAGLRRAVDMDPPAIKPRLMLFNFYFARRDYDRAEAALKELIEIYPENFELRLILGKFYYHLREMEKAAKAFGEAVRVGEGETAPLIMAGKFHAAVNRPEEALTMFRRALDLAPRNVNVLGMMAEFCLENGYHDEAKKTIAAILDQRPGYFPARLLQMRQAIAEKDYERALELGDRFLQSNPASGELLTLKGEVYLARDELEQAEKFLERAVQAEPENIDARIKLADVYLRQGKIASAQKVNRDILAFLQERPGMMIIMGDRELQPQSIMDSPESIESLSRFVSVHPFGRLDLEPLGRLRESFDRIIRAYESLLQQNPTQLRLFENIIMLHVARQEYDSALASCDQQIERLDNHPSQAAAVYNIKGGLLLALGQNDEAAVAYETAIDLAPDFLRPYYGLAKCYIADQDIDSAIAQYRVILERDPDQAAPHLLLGILFRMSGDTVAAERHYRRALEVEPDFTRAANNLAYLLAERGENLGEALELALAARDQDPQDPYIHDTLGWVYYRKGQYEDAVRELTIAVNGLPENALARYHLGMAFYKAGDLEKARYHLEKVLMTDDAFAAAEDIKEILDSIKEG